MNNEGLLANRLRWARQEQGITLQALSERSGRAVSYLSQLEHGVKANPTKQTVEAVATALHVRPAFLFGEVPGPDDHQVSESISGEAASYGRAFQHHFEGLSEREQTAIGLGDHSLRFGLVVRFLLDRFARNFTPIELAWQLGMSLGQYQAIVTRGHDVSHLYLEQLARIAGIPLCFLTHGRFQVEQADLQHLSNEALRYTEAIRLAMECRLSPERLEALIRMAVS